jgi:hypothetical protein
MITTRADDSVRQPSLVVVVRGRHLARILHGASKRPVDHGSQVSGAARVSARPGCSEGVLRLQHEQDRLHLQVTLNGDPMHRRGRDQQAGVTTDRSKVST